MRRESPALRPVASRRLGQKRRDGTPAGDFVCDRRTTMTRNDRERPESHGDGRNQPGEWIHPPPRDSLIITYRAVTTRRR